MLLDMCCGTGTIGQTLAKRVSRVVGVEMVADAVKDAESNAKRNGRACGCPCAAPFVCACVCVCLCLFVSLPPSSLSVSISLRDSRLHSHFHHVGGGSALSVLAGISNVVYFTGKAEDVTAEAIKDYADDNLVAVVDPPRAGLHPSVAKTIRKCEGIQRLIYVSCNLKGASQNIVE